MSEPNAGTLLTGDTGRDVAALSALVGDLLEEWDALAGIKADPRKFIPARVALTYSFCAHAHRLAHVAVGPLGAGLTLEAMPLVRAAYESAINAQWLVQVEDALAARLHEEYRARKNLIDTMGEAASFAGHDVSGVQVMDEAWSGHGSASPKFNDICDDFENAGKDAYVHYRFMSSFCHPSLFLADQYIAAADDEASGVRLLTQPTQLPALGSWYILASSLVWAARAVDFMDKAKPRRNRLRALARQMQIPEFFAPTAKALHRSS